MISQLQVCDSLFKLQYDDCHLDHGLTMSSNLLQQPANNSERWVCVYRDILADPAWANIYGRWRLIILVSLCHVSAVHVVDLLMHIAGEGALVGHSL